jgi:hypothetical protein
MSVRLPIDDCQLLKLLATGVGECAAAKQMGIPSNEVTTRVKKYLERGILQSKGEHDTVDWRAYGHWMRNGETSNAI